MKLLPVILIILLSLTYFGYLSYQDYLDKKVMENVQSCVEGFPKDNYLSATAQDFCSCNADFVRQNPYADKNKPEIKKQISAQVRGCMEKYNKPVILGECEKTGKKMIEENGAYYIQCECFYNKLVEPMLSQWVDGKISSEKMKGGAQKMALDSLNACMKMR